MGGAIITAEASTMLEVFLKAWEKVREAEKVGLTDWRSFTVKYNTDKGIFEATLWLHS